MDEHCLKLIKLESSSGGTRSLVVASLVELPSGEEAKIAEVLSKLFESLQISSPSIILNIPRHLAIVKSMKLPSTDEVELEKMSKMEVLRQLPYSEEDILDGFKVTERSSDGYSHVLSASILKITVERLLKILKLAGLMIQKISLSSESLFLWFTQKFPQTKEKNILFVNVDEDSLDIVVIQKGKLAFTRGVLLNMDPSPNEEKILEDIAISAETYQNQSSQELNEIYVCDVENKIKSSPAALSQKLKISTQRVAPDSLSTPGNSAALKNLDKHSFASLLGIGFYPEKVEINLIPKYFIQENRLLSIKKDLILLLLMVVMVVVSVLGICAKHIHEKKASLALLNTEIKKYEPRVSEIKKMLEDIDTVKKEIDARPLAIDVLSQIFKVTPEGVRLNLLDYEAGQSIVLRGIASTNTEVYSYARALKKSGIFESINVRYVNQHSGETKQIVDFEIGAEVPVI